MIGTAFPPLHAKTCSSSHANSTKCKIHRSCLASKFSTADDAVWQSL